MGKVRKRIRRQRFTKRTPPALTQMVLSFFAFSVPSFLLIGAMFLFLSLPFLTGKNDLLWVGSFMTGIALAGLIGMGWLAFHRRPFRFTLPEAFLYAFLGWQWLMIFRSIYPWASFLEAGRWTCFGVILFALRRWMTDDRRRRWLLGAFLGGSFAAALQGLYDYAVNVTLGNPAWRIFGPFLNPNLFANFLVLAFFVALGLVMGRFLPGTLLPWLLPLSLWMALMLTASKGAFFAGLVGLVVFGGGVLSLKAPHFWPRKGWLLGIIIGGALLCAFGLVVLLPPMRVRFITLLTTQVQSWMFRWLIWKATVIATLHQPFWGYGPGTFEWIYPQFALAGFTRHAHNGFLQVALESGIVGLALLSAFFVLTVKAPLRSLREGTPHSWLNLGGIAGIIAFCVHDLVDTTWLTPANLWALAFLCGVVLSDVPERWSLSFPKNLIAALPIFLTAWHGFSVAGGMHYLRGAQEEVLPSVKLYWLEKAIKVDPLNARLMIQKALLLEGWGIATGDEGRLQEALTSCERAIQLQPTRSGNYKVKARLLEALGREREAERALRQALRFNRVDTEAMWQLSQLLKDLGREGEAVKMYREMVALKQSPYGQFKPIEQWEDPFIAAAQVHLAEWLMKRGERKEAQRHLREARRMLKTFRDAYLPILEAADPEAAQGQKAFVDEIWEALNRLESELDRRPRQPFPERNRRTILRVLHLVSSPFSKSPSNASNVAWTRS